MKASATAGTIQPVVERGRQRGAVGEVLAALDGVDQDGGAGEAEQHVPPADPVAEPRGHRKQQEAQHQHEGDMGVAQRLGRDDREVGEWPGAGHRGVEVEQRHRHRDPGGGDARHAHQAIGRALVRLHIGFGDAQRLRRNGGIRLDCRLGLLGHAPLAPALSARTGPNGVFWNG
jgi:hypothetical protein